MINIINTEILYNASNKDAIDIKITENINGYCKMCGKSIQNGFHEKLVLSSLFTNFSELKAIDSKYFCHACVYCLKYDKLRTKSFACDNQNLYLLDKNDLEEYIFNLDKYIKGEFVFCITQSFKKHGSFRASVNIDTKQFYIRMEDIEFMFDSIKLQPVYSILNEAYLQFTKDEMRTGDYKSISIIQYGLEKFQKLEFILKQYRGMPQFDLMIHMLNSERRNDYIEKLKQEQKEKNKKGNGDEKCLKTNQTHLKKLEEKMPVWEQLKLF